MNREQGRWTGATPNVQTIASPLKPHHVIAVTPTTRVRVFKAFGRERVAVWRAFKLIATLVCALALVGCAGRESTYVGYDAGIDRADVLAAVALWNDSSPAFALGVSPDGRGGDVTFRMVDTLTGQECAETDLSGGYEIRVSRAMGPSCRSHLAAVYAHELGHWMAMSGEHVHVEGALMHPYSNHMGAKPTAADVAYARGE